MRTSLAVRAAMSATIAGSMILLSAACARADGAPGTADTPYQYDADAVVLRVQWVGGFVMPATLLTRLPLVTIYGDGRLVTQGPQIEIYPGPALPNVQIQHIDPANLDKLVQLALDAGVGGKPDLGEPGVTDLPSTRFTVLTSKGAETLDAYALVESDLPGLNQAQRAARKKLLDLQNALTDPSGVLGKGSVSESVEFQPAAVAGVVTPWTKPGDDQPAQQPKAWPGPALPGPSIGHSGLEQHCVTVSGSALGAVLAAARQANMLTPWTSGGKQWAVAFRPLLPDERDCGSLSLQS
jgi:hypothetical protein